MNSFRFGNCNGCNILRIKQALGWCGHAALRLQGLPLMQNAVCEDLTRKTRKSTEGHRSSLEKTLPNDAMQT
ncbi:MAG: hypothetical protein QGH12_02645, partial [SAR324 cluster bacterium]|nr:hypothetical protein [SAR324 cluster bacterium]